ncbi:MAG TPA: BadF/BadG/BcrA/BcrD ATPase family protein [Candidatus Acidoferrales bacterium]|nr:BadF/BadG/BcrA/BcrD ATPase family protein [Candidatus Acidoferrales bacterium]
MKLFAGIDGGQSSTEAVVADERKTILGRGVAGPCDHVGQAPDSPRFARALEEAIAGALDDAKLPADSPFEAIVAGISGYEGEIHGLPPKLNARRVTFLHDSHIAHAGAFELGDGIVVIAGTGSVAYGRANGKDVLVGGWGYLFGDWGSAFSTALHTLQVLMRLEDEGATSVLTEPALRFFKRSSLREIARAFYTGEIDRVELARFATELLRLAETGGKEEGGIPYTESFAISHLVESCARRLGVARVEVALCGGMFASEWYRNGAIQGIHKYAPGAVVVPAKHDALTGALLLAYKEEAGP